MQVCIFYLFFWDTSFFCLSALFMFTPSADFDELFINFSNICIIIIYIVGVRCFSQSNNLWEQIYVIKLNYSLNKKHASRELLRFKNFIYKEKCGTFTKRESVKETPSANGFFSENLTFQSIHLGKDKSKCILFKKGEKHYPALNISFCSWILRRSSRCLENPWQKGHQKN